METENVVQTEVTSSPEVQTPSSAPTPEVNVSHGTNPAPVGEGAPPAPFVPNFKFKVRDEEKEFDDWVRPLVKDADMEKKIRDLYTKAHGLEPLKQRMSSEVDSWKGKANEVSEKYTGISEQLQKLSYHVNHGDFDTFFDSLKIPKQDIFKWVQRKIDEQSMAPEQRQEIERQRQVHEQLYQLQRQNEELKTYRESFATQQAETHLSSALAKPEIETLAKTFDERVGRAGAFRDEVIQRGFALEKATGREVSPEEVLNEMGAIYGKILGTSQAPAEMGMPQMGAGGKPPVIPNIASKGTSPLKQAPKSVKEIREYAKTL